jgi:hypothetical protein
VLRHAAETRLQVAFRIDEKLCGDNDLVAFFEAVTPVDHYLAAVAVSIAVPK